MKDKDNLDIRKRSIFSSSAESLTSLESMSISTQEQIYENIKIHKEIIQSVKNQPWSLSKKYKIVQKLKRYIAQHEDTLQERFAQSGNTFDLYARVKILIADKFKKLRREFWNFCSFLIPWEMRIKEIESRFGSVVASYFIFLRWLFWVNIIIATTFSFFVIVPELLAMNSRNPTDPEFIERKVMLEKERKTAMNFLTVWDFEGYLKYSPLFYGFYSKSNVLWGYQVPIAYFLAGLVVYVYSFFATLKKMADNSRNAKLVSKEDDCAFSWRLFSGWDFLIGHSETASNRTASVVMGFKESLLEEREKQKDKKNWKVICLRFLANICVLVLLCISAFLVVWVVKRSNEKSDTWWRRNEITVVMSSISFLFPMLFELLGLMEYYHPRMQLRLQLARIMILNLLNLYSLIWALFGKIKDMTDRLTQIKTTRSVSKMFSSTTRASLIEKITEIPLMFPSTQKSESSTIINFNASFDSVTEDYNYNNPDYFEVDQLTESSSQAAQTTLGSTDYYENFTRLYENITDFWLENDTNISSQLMENSTFIVSQFMNLTNLTLLDTNAMNMTDSSIEDIYADYQYENMPSYSKMVATPIQNYIELNNLNASTQLEIRRLCWETMFGTELMKLTVMDLLLTVLQIIMFDFFRALFVRHFNGCWCWDLEKRFPKYGDFKIAENILHLVNNQGMVWMGMFFSPGLALLNVFKLVLILYLRSWAVLTCNVPHEIVFRASRSNNFYLTLLLTMLFLCVLPVSYAIVWLEPSMYCGPFSGNAKIYYLFTDSLKNIMPRKFHFVLEYIASPAAIIPLLLLLILFIYYLISLTSSLRMANQDLKQQLHKERTEERKKMMKLMEDKFLDPGNAANKLSSRWKRALQGSSIKQPLSSQIMASSLEDAERRKKLLAHAMGNLLQKRSMKKEEQAVPTISLEP